MKRQVENLLTRIIRNRLGSHLLFWVTIYVVFTVAPSSLEAKSYNAYKSLLMTLPVLASAVIAAYLLNYYLVPKFFNPKNALSFLFLFVASAYLICAFARIMTVHVTEPMVRPENFTQDTLTEILTQIDYLITVYFPSIYFIAFAMMIIKQQKAQLEISQRNVLLEKEKSETELNFLKAQIHPHFLFNTLNNLYLLTLKKSDKAPETVIKLSEILDYMLYRSNDKLVSVEKEIKLLDNYIALEKLRYGDQLKVSFKKEVEDKSIGISPLLLLSIVENAFKHGASGVVENPEIKVNLKINNHALFFEVYNKKSSFTQPDRTNYKKGIGVSNIRRQLSLLYSKHNFDIVDREGYYLVRLSIDLNSDISTLLDKDSLQKLAETNKDFLGFPA